MKIGFTSTSFRQIKSVEKVTEIAVESGADIIEWGGDVHVKDERSAKHVRSLCDAAGLEISSYGSYYRVGSGKGDEWKRICEISSLMNCGSVRVWLGNKDSEKTGDSEYAEILGDMRRICGTAKDYGLRVCPECHDRTYNNNTDAFLKLYSEAGCDNFGTYFQSRYRKKEYDLDRIERTLPYIESVHISYSEQTREQLPGHDGTYIDALVDKLVSCGFDGNMLVEYTYIFSWMGIPSMMIKDIEKIRKKVGGLK